MPDGRELKIALEGGEWLVLVEGDEHTYRGRNLRLVLAEAVDAEAATAWLVELPIRSRLRLLLSKAENTVSGADDRRTDARR
jgi:hypothetical protein